MFTLAISCLTTFNLLWFMELGFKIPVQYCSLQHGTLLPSPVTSTTGCRFCFGSVSSFFLELFLHSSPVAYWAPNDLGSSSFSIIFFYLFIQFMEWSGQEFWRCLPFPSKVDHIFSEISTMTLTEHFSEHFQMFKLDLAKPEEPEINNQQLLANQKSKRVPEKHVLLLYWLRHSLWLCGS